MKVGAMDSKHLTGIPRAADRYILATPDPLSWEADIPNKSESSTDGDRLPLWWLMVADSALSIDDLSHGLVMNVTCP